MGASPADPVAENQPDHGTNKGDEQALQEEDSPNLFRCNTEAHQNGDVAGLFHDDHREGDEDVQGCYAHNQGQNDEGDDLLQPQGPKQLAVLLHPGGRLEARSSFLFDKSGDLVGR